MFNLVNAGVQLCWTPTSVQEYELNWEQRTFSLEYLACYLLWYQNGSRLHTLSWASSTWRGKWSRHRSWGEDSYARRAHWFYKSWGWSMKHTHLWHVRCWNNVLSQIINKRRIWFKTNEQKIVKTQLLFPKLREHLTLYLQQKVSTTIQIWTKIKT